MEKAAKVFMMEEGEKKEKLATYYTPDYIEYHRQVKVIVPDLDEYVLNFEDDAIESNKLQDTMDKAVKKHLYIQGEAIK